MKKVLVILVVLALGGAGFLYMQSKKTSTNFDISIEEGKLLTERPDIIILDVRPKADLPKGIIPNAINIDVTKPEFEDALQKLDKTKEYVVYCNVGQRSSQAIKKMEQAGFTKLYHIREGIKKWKETGLPVTMPTQQQ